MELQGRTIEKYLKRFPSAGSLTLARIIYNENKELFASVESVRGSIRYRRGASGEKNFGKLKNKEFLRETPEITSFPELPEGITSLDEWEILKITGDHKVLILNDIHLPYHVKRVVELSIEKGLNHNVDIVLLNGDIFDFFSISKWQKDPRKRDFAGEIKVCKQFLEWLRHKFPKAEIIFKLGNHEERLENYMFIKAPELLGVPTFEFKKILELDKYGIQEVDGMKPIKLNECFVIHGHEYKFAISNPVNPARGLYLKSKVNAIAGHFHQSSSHSEKDIEDKVTSCWSLGCLCDLHPDYMPLNKHNHGFGVIEMNGDKLFNVFPYKIIDNQIYSE